MAKRRLKPGGGIGRDTIQDLLGLNADRAANLALWLDGRSERYPASVLALIAVADSLAEIYAQEAAVNSPRTADQCRAILMRRMADAIIMSEGDAAELYQPFDAE